MGHTIDPQDDEDAVMNVLLVLMVLFGAWWSISTFIRFT